LKDSTANTVYWAVDKAFSVLDAAVSHIEKNDFEEDLREKVIDVWEDIEKMFLVQRKEKRRF